MLEKLGFRYEDFIDPFDGGPHLEAVTNDIPLVRDTRWLDFAGRAAGSRCKRPAIVSTLNTDGEFLALQSNFATSPTAKLLLPDATIEGLKIEPSTRVGVTPLDGLPPSDEPSKRRTRSSAGASSKPSTKKKTKKKTKKARAKP